MSWLKSCLYHWSGVIVQGNGGVTYIARHFSEQIEKCKIMWHISYLRMFWEISRLQRNKNDFLIDFSSKKIHVPQYLWAFYRTGFELRTLDSFFCTLIIFYVQLTHQLRKVNTHLRPCFCLSLPAKNFTKIHVSSGVRLWWYRWRNVTWLSFFRKTKKMVSANSLNFEI